MPDNHYEQYKQQQQQQQQLHHQEYYHHYHNDNDAHHHQQSCVKSTRPPQSPSYNLDKRKVDIVKTWLSSSTEEDNNDDSDQHQQQQRQQQQRPSYHYPQQLQPPRHQLLQDDDNKNDDMIPRSPMKSIKTNSTASLTNLLDDSYIIHDENYDYYGDIYDHDIINNNNTDTGDDENVVAVNNSKPIVYGEILSKTERGKYNVVWDVLPPPKPCKFDWKECLITIATFRFCVPMFCPPVVDRSSTMKSSILPEQVNLNNNNTNSAYNDNSQLRNNNYHHYYYQHHQKQLLQQQQQQQIDHQERKKNDKNKKKKKKMIDVASTPPSEEEAIATTGNYIEERLQQEQTSGEPSESPTRKQRKQHDDEDLHLDFQSSPIGSCKMATIDKPQRLTNRSISVPVTAATTATDSGRPPLITGRGRSVSIEDSYLNTHQDHPLLKLVPPSQRPQHIDNRMRCSSACSTGTSIGSRHRRIRAVGTNFSIKSLQEIHSSSYHPPHDIVNDAPSHSALYQNNNTQHYRSDSLSHYSVETLEEDDNTNKDGGIVISNKIEARRRADSIPSIIREVSFTNLQQCLENDGQEEGGGGELYDGGYLSPLEFDLEEEDEKDDFILSSSNTSSSSRDEDIADIVVNNDSNRRRRRQGKPSAAILSSHHYHQQSLNYPTRYSNVDIQEQQEAAAATAAETTDFLSKVRTYSDETLIIKTRPRGRRRRRTSSSATSSNYGTDDYYHDDTVEIGPYSYLPQSTVLENELLHKISTTYDDVGDNTSESSRIITHGDIIVSGWVAFSYGTKLLSQLESSTMIRRKNLFYMIIVSSSDGTNNKLCLFRSKKGKQMKNNKSSSTPTFEQEQQIDLQQLLNNEELVSIDLLSSSRNRKHIKQKKISVESKMISSKHGHAIMLVDNDDSSSINKNNNSNIICTILPISLTNQFFRDVITKTSIVSSKKYHAIQSCMFTPFVQQQQPTIIDRDEEVEDYYYAPDEQHDAVMHIRFALDSLLR